MTAALGDKLLAVAQPDNHSGREDELEIAETPIGVARAQRAEGARGEAKRSSIAPPCADEDAEPVDGTQLAQRRARDGHTPLDRGDRVACERGLMAKADLG